jgi:hypothetical protein
LEGPVVSLSIKLLHSMMFKFPLYKGKIIFN